MYISPSSWASGSSLLPTVIGTFVDVLPPPELPVFEEPPHAARVSMSTTASNSRDFARNERVREAISSSLKNLHGLINVCAVYETANQVMPWLLLPAPAL